MEQRIEEINAAEAAWLQQLLDELLAQGVNPVDIHALGRYYDTTYATWAAADPSLREDPNAVVNRVGAGLGEHLRTRLPLRWVVVTDEYGTDMCVHGQPGDVVIAPMSMVGKRWSDGVTGFLPDLADTVVGRLTDVMRANP